MHIGGIGNLWPAHFMHDLVIKRESPTFVSYIAKGSLPINIFSIDVTLLLSEFPRRVDDCLDIRDKTFLSHAGGDVVYDEKYLGIQLLCDRGA